MPVCCRGPLLPQRRSPSLKLDCVNQNSWKSRILWIYTITYCGRDHGRYKIFQFTWTWSNDQKNSSFSETDEDKEAQSDQEDSSEYSYHDKNHSFDVITWTTATTSIMAAAKTRPGSQRLIRSSFTEESWISFYV